MKKLTEWTLWTFLGRWLLTRVEAPLIRRRLTMAKSSASTLSNIWKDISIHAGNKDPCYEGVGFPVALYGCETWVGGKADRRASSWIIQSITGDQPSLKHRIDKHKLNYFGREIALKKIIIDGTLKEHVVRKTQTRTEMEWRTEGDH